MIYRYAWEPTGDVVGPCTCGQGSLLLYEVKPPRSPAYLNRVVVCDNDQCREQKGSRRLGLEGRVILA